MANPPPANEPPIVVYGVQGPSGHNPQQDYGVPDCAIFADSLDGAGILGSSNAQAGVIGIRGDLPLNAQQGHTPAGVWGAAKDQIGVLGMSDSGDGVAGKSGNGAGVTGVSNAEDSSFFHAGVVGKTNGSSGTGVFGYAPPAGRFNVAGDGVVGIGARGVWGLGSDDGVQGSVGSGSSGNGVFGDAVRGTGVRGFSNTGIGIVGDTVTGKAGFFHGDVDVTGKITKAAVQFKIDHPLDPANKYLYHSSVESPDMKNVYDGIVVLDDRGEASVELPEWFEALNGDFRYQLTPMRSPGPDLHVACGIEKSRFKIAGGLPGMEVCWQVTGIRRDAWAQCNRLPVEQDKRREEKGRYLHPEAFREPITKGIFVTAPREANERARESFEDLIKLAQDSKRSK